MKKIIKLLLQLLASFLVGFGTLTLTALGLWVLIDVAVKSNAMPLFTVLLGAVGIYASYLGSRWFISYLRSWLTEKSQPVQPIVSALPKKTRLLLAPLWIGFTATVGALMLVTITAFGGAPGAFTFFSGFWPAIFLTGFSVTLVFAGLTKSSPSFRKRILFLTIVSLLWWLGFIFTAWCQSTNTTCVPFYNPS